SSEFRWSSSRLRRRIETWTSCGSMVSICALRALLDQRGLGGGEGDLEGVDPLGDHGRLGPPCRDTAEELAEGRRVEPWLQGEAHDDLRACEPRDRVARLERDGGHGGFCLD